MRCAKARKMISDQIDGLLDSEKTAALASHIESCSECRELAQDFALIVEKAGKLPAAVEPLPETWARIAAGVKEAGMKRVVPAASPVDRRIAYHPALGLKAALAAGLALIVIGGGIAVGLKWSRGPVVPEKGSLEYTLAKLDEAQKYYEKAAASLIEAIVSQKDRMDPRLVEAFEQNLQGINATILACEQIVRSQPENLTARTYLLAAYQNKVSFLEDMIGRGTSDPGIPGDFDL